MFLHTHVTASRNGTLSEWVELCLLVVCGVWVYFICILPKGSLISWNYVASE
jgi:hypothetical protein